MEMQIEDRLVDTVGEGKIGEGANLGGGGGEKNQGVGKLNPKIVLR